MNIFKVRQLAKDEIEKFKKEYGRDPNQNEMTAIAMKIVAGSPKLTEKDKYEQKLKKLKK
jgi:hypothetical protein